MNLLWTGQQKCCVRTVQCSGSKQKSQLFHYTITIVTANHNWWHEKIWITSNEFLIGNMYLILFISYSILLCKNRTLRWIKRLVNLINILLFISGMCFYKSYKTPKCMLRYSLKWFLPYCQEISKLVRTLRYVSKFFKISQK